MKSILDAVFGRRSQATGPAGKIIVGLGNPGRRYVQTRHNVGFWCVERLALDHSISFSRRHRLSLLGDGEIAGRTVALARPRTFVNRSGEAVSYLVGRYGLKPADLLVVCDDMELPSGRLRLRPGGSAAGHNGIRSIIETLGTQEFPRLRIGIGRPPPGLDPVEYVLGTMSKEERVVVTEAVERAARAVEYLLVEGIDVAMNRFN